ncbi:hypothetical protein BLS_006435 [Venturia inaequalis]|uniref:Fe2OG dioxygenase domain-containing protein n=1 Tax=Venturia inaequalis TaxID=5025 RepID=A0A8H3UDM0_VENIN|nr:hypothetical protein BLS_006435 [Venturia inaequalis]
MSSTVPRIQEYVTFHAAKGKMSRPILTGPAMKSTFESIPHVDFDKAFSESVDERRQVADKVGKAFKEVGFLYAINHGISEDLQHRTTAVIKEFFALQIEEKMKIHLHKSWAIQGYEPLLETRIDDSTHLKEAVNFSTCRFDPECGFPDDLDASKYPSKPTNQWPERPTSFRSTVLEYRKAVLAFSLKLVQIIALALDLPENHFDAMMKFPAGGIRPLHYPPQEVNTDVGLGAHADYSWFTLVNQLSATPALEVLNHNGGWVSAPPIANTLVVNVGDFLERASNDVFVSTVHRVVNKTGEERYSLPFFLSPNQDAIVEVLPSCISEERPARYESVRCGNWIEERLLRARRNHPLSVAARKSRGVE